MIKARASGSKVYLYFMKKGRQARHRIPRNSCLEHYLHDHTCFTCTGKNTTKIWDDIKDTIRTIYLEKEPSFLSVASKYKTTR